MAHSGHRRLGGFFAGCIFTVGITCTAQCQRAVAQHSYAQPLWSQQANPQGVEPRNTGGWVVSPSRESPSTSRSVSSPPVQYVNYQSQNSLSDSSALPPLPRTAPEGSLTMPSLPNPAPGAGSMANGLQAAPTLPSTSNLQNHVPPSAMNSASAGRLPNRSVPNANGPSFGHGGAVVRGEPPVLPESSWNGNMNSPPPEGASSQPDSTRGVPTQSATFSRPVQGQNRLPESSVRPIQSGSASNQQNSRPTSPAPQDNRIPVQAIATGYPYVSPPRTGNYMTRAINQTQYQLAAYQRSSPANTPAPATQARLAANTTSGQVRPTLPQYAASPYGNNFYLTSANQCGPSFPSTGVGSYAPGTLPANLTSGLYSPNNSGYFPLVSLGQENYNVLLGRGLVGQPTVYVPGQPLRNFLRYLSP